MVDGPALEQNQPHETIVVVVVTAPTIVGRMSGAASPELPSMRPQGVGVVFGTECRIQNRPPKDFSLAPNHDVGRQGQLGKQGTIAAATGVAAVLGRSLLARRRTQRPERRGNFRRVFSQNEYGHEGHDSGFRANVEDPRYVQDGSDGEILQLLWLLCLFRFVVFFSLAGS